MSVKTKAAARQTTPGIEAFEKAVKAFGKKEFDKASGLFDDILKSHSQERDLVDRARAYKSICERAEKKAAPRPKSFDEWLNQGVYLHNRGEYQEALGSFTQASELLPKNDSALYCLAAAQARLGKDDDAVKSLASAVRIDAANRAQARHDPDFDHLRDSDAFLDAIMPGED